MRNAGTSMQELARTFGLSRQTVERYLNTAAGDGCTMRITYMFRRQPVQVDLLFIPLPPLAQERRIVPWITVFDRVVQQNGKQTKHIFLHPTELDSGWDVGLQAFALRLCQRLKAFCAGLSHLAERKGGNGAVLYGFLYPGQFHQVFN